MAGQARTRGLNSPLELLTLEAALFAAKGLVCVCVLTTHLFDCMSKVCAGLHCRLQRFLQETNWPLAFATPLRIWRNENTHLEKIGKSSPGFLWQNAVFGRDSRACMLLVSGGLQGGL